MTISGSNGKMIHAKCTVGKRMSKCRHLSKLIVASTKMLPEFFQRGMHRQRQLDTKGTSYWSSFADAINGEEEKCVFSSGRGTKIAEGVCAAKSKVLLMLAERDACCDPVKLMKIQELLGKEACHTEVLSDCGHAGGPRNSRKSFLELAAPIADTFLSNGEYPERSTKL